MRSVGLSRVFGVGFTIVLSVLAIRSGVFADVAPGDVIDKTNWQKAEGLLPASVLNWVKTGDYILNVGELNYDQKEFHPPYVLDSLKANLGKYDVNEKDLIIEKDTGKAPKYIVGIPLSGDRPRRPQSGSKMRVQQGLHRLFPGQCPVSSRCTMDRLLRLRKRNPHGVHECPAGRLPRSPILAKPGRYATVRSDPCNGAL